MGRIEPVTRLNVLLMLAEKPTRRERSDQPIDSAPWLFKKINKYHQAGNTVHHKHALVLRLKIFRFGVNFNPASPSSSGVYLGRGLRGDRLSGGGVPRLPEYPRSGTRRLRHPHGGVRPTRREPAFGPGSGLHRYRGQPDLPGPGEHGGDRRSDRGVQGEDGLQRRVPAPPGRIHEAVLPGGGRPSPVFHRECLPRHLQASTPSGPAVRTCFKLKTPPVNPLLMYCHVFIVTVLLCSCYTIALTA